MEPIKLVLALLAIFIANRVVAYFSGLKVRVLLRRLAL